MHHHWLKHQRLPRRQSSRAGIAATAVTTTPRGQHRPLWSGAVWNDAEMWQRLPRWRKSSTMDWQHRPHQQWRLCLPDAPIGELRSRADGQSLLSPLQQTSNTPRYTITNSNFAVKSTGEGYNWRYTVVPIPSYSMHSSDTPEAPIAAVNAAREDGCDGWGDGNS